MLIQIGNAVVNSEDVAFAHVGEDKTQIVVQFRSEALPTLNVKTNDAESDLAKLERCSVR